MLVVPAAAPATPAPLERCRTLGHVAGMSVAIRPATGADAGRLALVGAATFLETFAGTLDGDAIVAHCARVHAAAAYAEALAGGARAWLAEAAPRLLLGVFAGNARARAFYGRHGFRPVGERRFAVGDRAYDDVVLARPL